MAKFKKKDIAPAAPINTASVPAPAPDVPASVTPVAPISDIPLPAEVKAEEAVLAATPKPAPAIEVVDVPAKAAPIGVVNKAVEEAAMYMPPRNAIPESFVNIRALCDSGTPPRVGTYDFEGSVGKDARTGKPVQGKYLNGYIYRVPAFVADMLVERNWALRV